MKSQRGKGAESFSTKAYLLGIRTPPPGAAAKSKKNPLKDENGRPRSTVTMEDQPHQPGLPPAYRSGVGIRSIGTGW